MLAFAVICMLGLSLYLPGSPPTETPRLLGPSLRPVLPSTAGQVVTCLDPSLTGLWVGTRQGGLLLVDPLSSTLLRKGKKGQRIRALQASAFGLWVASSDGLHVTAPDGTEEAVPFPEGLEVLALARTEDRLWAGTNRGLFAWDGESWKGRSPSPALPVEALTVDSTGRLWAATSRGLLRLEGEHWLLETVPGRRGKINALLDQPGRGLWCASDEGLSLRSPSGRWRQLDGVTGPVYAVAFRENQVWAGGTEGLWTLGSDDAAPRLEGRDLQVFALAADEDVLWVGTDQGLARHVPAAATVPSGAAPSEGATAERHPVEKVWGAKLQADPSWRLPGELQGASTVFRMAVDEERDRVWLATSRGLLRLDREGRLEEHWHEGNGLGGRVIRSVALDRATGLPWVAGIHGLSHLTEAGWQRWGAKEGLPQETLWDVMLLGGAVWVASDGGIHRLEGSRWQSWTEGNSRLVENTVTALAGDGRGGIWAAVWNGGMARFDGSDWSMHRDPDGSPDKDLTRDDGLLDEGVTACAADDSGTLWVGSTRGLCRFDGTRWTDVPWKDHGLPAPWITALRPGPEDGSMWVATSKGFALIDDRRWLHVEALFGPSPALLLAEGQVGRGEERRSYVPGTWSSSFVRDVAIFGTRLLVATDRGLSALRIGTARGGRS